MKSRVIRNTVAAAVITLLLPVTGIAGMVIGDWESGLDGWYDWTAPDATVMTGGQTEGVTLGFGSLLVDEAGWGQNLAITLDAPQITAFMENSIFSIDVSVAETAGIIEGYSQILEVAFNSGDPGWTPVTDPNPLINFWWWEDRPDETQTLQVDYSAFRDQISDTGYIQIILITNTGGGAPSQMYFDNAQLVPEPATLGLISIFGGGLFLMRRRFRI